MDFFSIVKNPVGEGEVIGEDDWSITRASGVAEKNVAIGSEGWPAFCS